MTGPAGVAVNDGYGWGEALDRLLARDAARGGALARDRYDAALAAARHTAALDAVYDRTEIDAARRARDIAHAAAPPPDDGTEPPDLHPVPPPRYEDWSNHALKERLRELGVPRSAHWKKEDYVAAVYDAERRPRGATG